MRIILSSPDHARHVGKRLSKIFQVRLTRGYALAAALLGYSSWDELLHYCDWDSDCTNSPPACPDSQCSPAEVTARREFQIEALMAATGLDRGPAVAVVEQVRPTDGFRPPATS